MKVLILHSRYRSGPVSGENRVVEDEARLLNAAGHAVDVFSPRVADLSFTRMFSMAADTIWSSAAVSEVRRRLDAFRPDIVHCHNLYPALSPAVIRTAAERAPVVVTLHNYRLMCLPGTFLRSGAICEDCRGRSPWPGIVHGCYRSSRLASGVLASSLIVHRLLATFERVALYIAISGFVRSKYAEGGLDASRMIVKPHFAWPTPRRRGAGDHFLYMGRLSPEKGVGTLLRAWTDVNSPLVIVGDGPEASRLRSMAPPNVRFAGPVDRTGTRRFLRAARGVLAPSISYEAAGKVVLEAYAAGVPVVVSNLGGLPEVVQDGVTGLILPPADSSSWTEAAHRLLDNDESQRMGQAAFHLWSTRYSPEQGIANLEGAYRRALL